MCLRGSTVKQTPLKRRAKSNGQSGSLPYQLDALFAKVVKMRAGHTCEWCGGQATDAHHQYGRRLPFRWMLEAGVALCRDCHDAYTNGRKARGKLIYKTDRLDDYLTCEAIKKVPHHRFDMDLPALKKYFEGRLHE